MAASVGEEFNRPGSYDRNQDDDWPDDLVRQVSDLVYAMLQRDLKLERERMGFERAPLAHHAGSLWKGGW